MLEVAFFNANQSESDLNDKTFLTLFLQLNQDFNFLLDIIDGNLSILALFLRGFS